MSIGTLYLAYPEQSKGLRIKATAAVGGLTLDEPTRYVHYTTNKTPEFTAKFSSGKVPAFEDKDGFCLFEGNAIARYIASLSPNTTLLGSNLKEAALVDQWISFFDTEIDGWLMLLKHIRSRSTFNKAYDTEVRGRFARPFETVETHLSKHTFLVGERLSLADISAATVLRTAYSFLLGNAERAKYPHTFRFYETVISQPNIKDILAGGQLAEMAQEYVPPIKAPSEEKPKAETPKAEPGRRAEYEEEEPLAAEEPTRKIPPDGLPKSSFNLEEWKSAYSNLKTRGVGGSLEWFYEKFDREGFSIWRVDFKYPEDLTQVFMSSNQIGGFFNRLEGSRKYLFGSIGVLGTANNSLISGALVLRGHDYKPVVHIAPDWESYGYKELDINSSEDKKFFEAALAWDLSIDGKAWADGKNFK